MKNIYILAVGCLVSSTVLSQTTTSFTAVADNTLRQELPNNSSGAAAFLYVGMTDNGDRRRSLVRFDLSSIPAGSTITSVTLTMTANNPRATAGIPVSLHRVNSQWGEGTSGLGSGGGGQGSAAQANDATWNMRLFPSTTWTTPGGDFVTTGSATTTVNASGTPVWTSTQMIADVQNWVSNPATNFGWLLKSTESGVRNAKRLSSKESATATARPTLSVTYNLSTTAVSLVAFSANESSRGIDLLWKTSSEYNNAFFAVEHSTDGSTFKEIGKVNGAGTTNTARSYAFLHQFATKGVNYYRLAQVDINHRTTYSPVIDLKLRGRQVSISVFPNPITDAIYLQGVQPAADLRYQIIGISGTVIQAGTISSSKINASRLAAGSYVLRIFDKENTYTGKFVKQ